MTLQLSSDNRSKYKVIRKEPCLACRAKGRDRSGDNRIVYADENGAESYHCFSCSDTKASSEYRVNDSYKDRYVYEIQSMGPFTIDMWSRFKETTGVETRGWRGLTKETCAFYGVRHNYDDGGNVEFQYYPVTKNYDLCGLKWRSADKKWNNKGDADSDCDLFGQVAHRTTSSKTVIIASGEIDTLSIFQALNPYCKQKGWEPPVVVCGIAGEGSYKQYQKHYDWLNKFEKIIVCPDNDEPGQKHLHNLVKVLPRNKVFLMELPLKDANECLVKNKTQAMFDGYFRPRAYTPSGIIGSDVLEQALLEGIKKVKIPLPPFLRKLEVMLRGGIRMPSIVNIVGPTGIGKSTYVNELLYYWIFESPYTLGILSLEADRSEYSNVIASRHLGVKLNLLDDLEAEEFLLRPENIEKRKLLWSRPDGSPRFYMMEERDGKLENIKKLIEQLIIACGCRIIVIDPIQDLFAGLSISEQEEFSAWLKITIKAYDVCFVCINHIRKSQGGGVDARYSEQEVKGSSTLIQSSFLTILLNREKDPDPTLSELAQKILLSTMTHRVSKNRATGLTGDGGSLFYDNTTHTLYDLDDYKEINPEMFEPSEATY